MGRETVAITSLIEKKITIPSHAMWKTLEPVTLVSPRLIPCYLLSIALVQ